MKRRYYLAYGSNLNMRQMKMRCPDSKPVGCVILEDYELLFRGGSGCAVATIEPKSGGIVPCGLWLVSTEDEAALDIYEGWPNLYRKEMVPVRFGRRGMKVMAYIMNEGHDIGVPSRLYFDTILHGYRDFGLDPAELYTALKSSKKAAVPYKPII